MSREVRRVPLDFDWPLKKVWQGYLMPERLRLPDCTACDGRGDSPRARELHNRYWGYSAFRPEENGSTPLTAETPVVRAYAERNVTRAPEFYGVGELAIVREARRLARLWNGMWLHHLNQDDVDVLIAHDRLRDFTHEFVPGSGWRPRDPMPRPTVEEVNVDSITTMRGDDREGVLIQVRCEREGVSDRCATCDGEGTFEAWEGQRAEREAWEPTPPPAGEGWQLWETTSEGSPVGPVFGNAEGLAGWLTTAEGGAAVGFGSFNDPMAWEEALGFVKAGSTVGSMIAVGGVVHDGAAWVGSEAALGDRS